MSQYLLKISGSNEVVNLIEWDGSGSLQIPSIYELELFTTESVDFIPNLTASIDAVELFNGTFTGDFIGNLSGSVTLNGIELSRLNDVTKFGTLTFVSGAYNEDNYFESSFMVDDVRSPKTIIIPMTSSLYKEYDYHYSGSINRLLNTSSSFHIIKLKSTIDTENQIELYVSSSEFTGSNHLKLTVEELYNSLSNNSYFNEQTQFDLSTLNMTRWYIDFQTTEKTVVAGTFYGKDLKAENTLAVNDVDVATELEACDGMVALTNIDTAVKQYQKIYDADPNFGSFFLNSGTGPQRISIPPFIIHIPEYYWESNGVSQPFEITLPALIWSPYGSDDTSMRRQQRWFDKIQKIKNNTNREGISIRFGGFYRVVQDPNVGVYKYKRIPIKDWFIEAEFLNGDVRVHKAPNGTGGEFESAYTFTVRLKNGIKSIWSKYQDSPLIGTSGITRDIAYNIILNSTDLADKLPNPGTINLGNDRAVFCVQIEYDDICKDCGNDITETIETTELVRDDTNFSMKWHNTVTNYDPNGTPLRQLEDMEIGSIAIADPSRGIDDTLPFLGKFNNWPSNNFTSVNHLVIALSDGDGNNQVYDDWNKAIGNDGLNVEFTNIDGDMNVMYRMLNQVKLMQDLKPALYGRYPNQVASYSNEEYTSLMNIRCLHSNHTSSHSGPLETFDITSVEFIGSGLNPDKQWTDIIVAAGDTTLALKNKTSFVKSLWMWGTSIGNQIPYTDEIAINPTRISAKSWTSASMSPYHSMAIDGDNDIWVWGKNDYGQLGLKNFDSPIKSPRKLTDIQFTNYRIHKVSTGRKHSAIIARGNAESSEEVRGLWLAGDNTYGQLGFTSTNTSKTQIDFRVVNAGAGLTWLDASCGGFHTLAIKTTKGIANMQQGTLWACGRGERYVLGLGNEDDVFTFTQVGGKTDWKYIDAGTYHNFAIDSSGYLYAWGENGVGQLGLGDTTDRTTPTKVGNDTWKKVVACGQGLLGFSLGIKTDDSLWAWGENSVGQLGLGYSHDFNYRVTIESTSGNPGNGNILWNNSTQLNSTFININNTDEDGKDTDSILASIQTGDEIILTGFHPITNALISQHWTVNGTPSKVGNDYWTLPVTLTSGPINSEFVFIDDDKLQEIVIKINTDQHSPVRIGNDNDWTNIDGGFSHSIGTRRVTDLGRSANEIYTWGYNHFNQLGLNTTNLTVLSPTKISSVISNENHVTHAMLGVKWIGGSNAKHSDGLLTEKHKIKVSIQPMYTPYPSYYEIFTIYATQQDGSYKKWKYKGWEKMLKVICIGGGGGGGAAPLIQTGKVVTSAGGGGGGAISMAEFLASPMRVSGFQDNRPLFYGIPHEVDLWVGIGGYSSRMISDTPEIREKQADADALTSPLYADIVRFETQLKAIVAIRLNYVEYDFKSNSFILNKTQLDLDYPGNTYNTVQDIQDAIDNKNDEISATYGAIRTAVAPIEQQIKQIQDELSKLGTNGANGGFSRFGEYLIAAGGDGGKSGKAVDYGHITNITCIYDSDKIINDSQLSYTIDVHLLTDGGKGGGKEILLKTPETVKGKHKLYPFKATNTPNSGLSSTYLPGGNGGFGGIVNDDGNVLRMFSRLQDLIGSLIPDAEEDLFNAIGSGSSQRINIAKNNLNNLLNERLGILQLNQIYGYVYRKTVSGDIYNQTAESTFYSCTGGGGGFGFGGSIYGTKYSHELGTQFTKNVAAMLPQSVKLGQDIKIREILSPTAESGSRTSAFGAGFKIGLGGDGAYYGSNTITVDSVYSSLATTTQLGKSGGFPGGGGGGGIPSSQNYSDGTWKSNPRSGGDGGDGVVIVIGM